MKKPIIGGLFFIIGVVHFSGCVLTEVMTDTQLEKFEKIIGYEFKNKRLLERALTHSSYCNEIKRLKNQSNERLEFLGDAVLEVTVSDYLFEKLPEKMRKKNGM